MLSLSLKAGLVTAMALATANCASPNLVSSGSNDPKYGVPASPRVVAEGDPIPKGGGREMLGRPYVVAGRTYVPRDGNGYVREGLASWYGTAFHGRLTANGEIFDRESIAAAHPTLPLPSYTRVTNLKNNRSMIVRVNDRGPYHANRIMDVSEKVAEALDFQRVGTAKIRVEYLGKASTRGSDDSKLMATLRTDGRPAAIPGRNSTQFADLREQAPRPLAYRANDPGPAPVMSALPAESAPIRMARAEPVADVERSAVPEASIRLAHAPVPPERPFDLATIPSAAAPLSSAEPGRLGTRLPPVRPGYAGLFYAAPAPSKQGAGPFVALKPQRTVSLQKAAAKADSAR